MDLAAHLSDGSGVLSAWAKAERWFVLTSPALGPSHQCHGLWWSVWAARSHHGDSLPWARGLHSPRSGPRYQCSGPRPRSVFIPCVPRCPHHLPPGRPSDFTDSLTPVLPHVARANSQASTHSRVPSERNAKDLGAGGCGFPMFPVGPPGFLLLGRPFRMAAPHQHPREPFLHA